MMRISTVRRKITLKVSLDQVIASWSRKGDLRSARERRYVWSTNVRLKFAACSRESRSHVASGHLGGDDIDTPVS